MATTVVIMTLSYNILSLLSIASRSVSTVSECSQSRYLPCKLKFDDSHYCSCMDKLLDLDAHYKNDHSIFTMDGQSVTVSCTVFCPSSSDSLNDCSNNIHQDWIIIDPSEDKIYYLNAATSRNRFLYRFEIDEALIEFSDSNRLDFEQCSLNETSQFQFNLTLHNFTSSLEGLMVICGLRRYGHISADYHLVQEYARLRPISTGILFQ